MKNPLGYPWDTPQFKGDKNAWAWDWLDFHYLYWAKQNDDHEQEVFCRQLKKTKSEIDSLRDKLALAEKALEEIEAQAKANKCDLTLGRQGHSCRSCLRCVLRDLARTALARIREGAV